jgi:hypothetical protein
VRLLLLLDFEDPLTQPFVFLAQQLKVGHLWGQRALPIRVCASHADYCLRSRSNRLEGFMASSAADPCGALEGDRAAALPASS